MVRGLRHRRLRLQLGVILAFFGGELLLMCLKTVLNGTKNRKDDSE